MKLKKRALMVATVPSMIGQFNMNNISILLALGHQVDVAADFSDNSVWPDERIQLFKKQLAEMNIDSIQIDFSRNPLNFNRHRKSYKEITELINQRGYSLIHTHTPIASAIVRLAARKKRTKIVYTAHGFHFYKGAALKNWILFYPIEKWLSRYTDVLITINKEDYNRARKKFKAKRTEYVPGVGVDTEKFAPRQTGRDSIRAELGLKDSDIMLLSVGELNENKNHASVIKAIAGMNLTYVIVGKGERKEELQQLAEDNKVDLRLTGFRTDVANFYDAADVYVLPSIREGLNVSLMEAMASGLAVACGKIRGNVDLVQEDDAQFDPMNIDSIRDAVNYALSNEDRLGIENRNTIKKCSIMEIHDRMRKIYSRIKKDDSDE